MIRTTSVVIAAAYAGVALAASSHFNFGGATGHLAKRISTSTAFQQLYYQSNYQNGAQPPGYQDGDSPDQTIVINNLNGTDNNSPVSTCPIAYIGGAGVNGSEDGGWASKAQVVGFDTKYLDVESGVTMPYYIERKDYTKAQRIVMVFQGKPRDAWRYPNLMRYAGKCAVANPDWNTNFEDYIVTAPIIFNTDDLKAGGSLPTDLVWNSGNWATGSLSKGPGSTKYSSFKALDALVDQWFNTTMFPNVKSVVIAGHSAGAILAQRYAMLREPVAGQDENMKWLIADAGSYVWPVDDRPVENPKASSSCKTNAANCDMTAACEVASNEWPYGMNISNPESMNVYGRARVQQNKAKVIQDYYNRRVQYTFAALDDGAGDTHCEAQFQGDSHIARGKNLVAALQQAGATGFHTTYVANATHVDLEVFIDPATQQWVFVDGLTDARNGSSTSTSAVTSSSKKTAGSSSSSSSSTTSPAGRVAVSQSLVLGSVALIIGGCSAALFV